MGIIFLHEKIKIIIKLTMDRRAYSVNRLKTKQNSVLKRVITKSKLGQRIPLTLENIASMIVPLILMLIFIPPPKAVTVDKETSASGITYSGASIIVYNEADSVIDEFNLEEYLVGVVAAEMPASFHIEALKAQAIAARTFALSRARGLYSNSEEHFGAHVCTEPGHCQSWISKERYLENRGSEEAWDKITNAVLETENIVMTYAGQLINPLYHSNSGGVTEDIEAVWSRLGEVPYLKSVYSPDENQYAGYEKTTVFAWDEIKSKISSKYPEAKLGKSAAQDLEIMSYSSSGRIDKIRLGSVTISGTEFRELLSLPSTNLELRFLSNSDVEITSKGYGHGVGMSQCGADSLAKKGSSYKEILEFYYSGIMVEELRY